MLLRSGRRKQHIELKPVGEQPVALADEFFGGELENATLRDLPRLVLKGILYLQTEQEAKQLTGQQKKECLIKVLQDLCPNDLLDQFIPPLIDIICDLLKQKQQEPVQETRTQKRSWWCF